ncbi:hypothetical protein BAE44_0023347 [Dichanthelium oligosanthes]|uniref:KIB1-4 beta-propeller domain-containing protein n=1 Tax=Dichanthelium oligosanthes TaxID=888268 RepID=A0A1E5US38_9POAL|nr:hypothetical protein BAE44_0023347 [Dichanthelium oligosanthes]
MAGYYNTFSWSWPQDYDTSDDDEDDHSYNNGGGEVSSSNEEGEESGNDNDDDEAPNKEEEKDGNEEENQEEDEESDDDEAASDPDETEDICNGDDMVSDNEAKEYADGEGPHELNIWEVPYEAKDETYTARYLVQSLSGELLLVRRRYELPLESRAYTSKVEIFKADISAGKWLPITGSCLAEDEALLLSRSFSKSTRAHGDIEEGLVLSLIHI